MWNTLRTKLADGIEWAAGKLASWIRPTDGGGPTPPPPPSQPQ